MNFAYVSAFDALSSLARPTPDVVERFAWTLIHFLWQGVALAGLVALVLALLRRAAASTRYAVACAGLLLAAAAPVATFVALTPQRGSGHATAPRPIAFDVALPLSTVTTEPLPLSPLPVEQSSSSRYLPNVVLAWSAGAFALAAWRLFGWLHLRHLLRRQTSSVTTALRDRLDALCDTLRVRRVVRLLEAAWVEVPAVVGLFRPVILLPTSAMTGLSPQHLDALLAHELAHVRRHDYLVNLLQCLVETLLFYHPAVWWLSGIIRTEREHCCDDLAIRAVGDKLVYAQALADMEELRGLPPHLALAARGNGPLTVRIRRLVGTPGRSVRPARPLASALVAIACVLLPLTAATLQAQDEPSKSNTETKGEGTEAKADPAGLKTTPVAPEDLIYTPAEYTLHVGDLVAVSINDLAAAGVTSTRTARVGETGTFSLPLLREPIKAAGLTEEQFRKAIADQYQKHGLIQHAMIDVTITEARGQTFSVLGSAKPGQYTITDREFRLLDALITAQATQQEITSIQIIRPTRTEPGKAPEQPRIIEVEPKALLAGDVRQNPIVRPGDRIVVKAAEPKKAGAGDEARTGVVEDLLREREAVINLRDAALAKGLGKDHVDIRKLNTQLQLVEDRIDARRDEWRTVRAQTQPDQRAMSALKHLDEPDEILQTHLRERDAQQSKIEQMTARGIGATHPEMLRAKRDLEIAERRLEERRMDLRLPRGDDPAIAAPKFAVRGDVPRDGLYGFTKSLTLKQALTTAGVDPAQHSHHRVHMVRRTAGNDSIVFRDVPVSQCLEGVLAEIEIAPGDVVTVTKPPPVP